MLFLTLMETLPGRAADQTGFLKRISSVTSPTGINIRGVYSLFGRYDRAILLEAPDIEWLKSSSSEWRTLPSMKLIP